METTHQKSGPLMPGTNAKKMMMIFTHQMEIANAGSEPTFFTTRGDTIVSSIIDVTASSYNVAIVNWRVDLSMCAISRHCAIRFHLVIR